MRIARASLLAFGLSFFCVFTTAGAVDLDPTTHVAVPADFNGDGRLDALLQPLQASGGGAILLQDGTGSLSVVAQSWEPGYLGLDWSTASSRITAADLNGDGQDDVIVQPTASGGTAAVLITDPSLQLLQIAQLLPAGYLGQDWSAATRLLAGDFDGDRRKELLLQAAGPGQASAIVHADESGRVTAVTQSLPDGYLGRRWDQQAVTLYVGDLNGDGRQDLLIQVNPGATQAGESSYALLLADPDGRFTHLNEVWNDSDFGGDWSAATHTLSLQDLNHTGVMDVVLTSKTPGGSNYVFEPNAQGQFTQPAVRWTGTETAQQALARQASPSGTGISVTTASAPTAGTTTSSGMATTNLVNGQSATFTAGTAPVAANAVGELAGSGGVSGGSATYSIPIAVPPGRAGVQPSVSLSYSSRGGNGAVGMGWSLSAGSAIHRCPATVAQDGYTSGVTYSATKDRLCLDGQHLVVTQGTYGAVGSYYHTEMENYAKVHLLGGDINSTASYFEVDYPNGHVSYYKYQEVPANVSSPLVWDITQSQDLAGNTVVYDYTNPVTGEYHLSDIVYTGRVDSGGNTTQTGSREVTFTYAPRSDLSKSYLAGGLSQQQYILTNIDTYATGVHALDYSLSYAASPATDRSLLQSVQECSYQSGNSYCFAPTTFNWQAAAPAFAPKTPAFSIGSFGSDPIISIAKDYIGNGIRQLLYGTDILELDSNMDALAPPVDVSSLYSNTLAFTMDNDFNSDGAADALVQLPPGQGSQIEIANSNHSSALAFSSLTDTGITGQWAGAMLAGSGDFTGNGVNDIIATLATSQHTLEVEVFKNKGDGSGKFTMQSGGPIKVLDECQTAAPDGTTAWYPPKLVPAGDLDGNGVPDFNVYATCTSSLTPIGTLLLSHDTDGTVSANFINLGVTGDLSTSVIAWKYLDINGDGLQDYLYVASNGDWSYQLNRGNDSFAPPVDTGVQVPLSVTPSGMTTADLRNDGKDSLLYFDKNDPNLVAASWCIEKKVAGGTDTNATCGMHLDGPYSQFDNTIYHYTELTFAENSSGIYVPSVRDFGIYGRSNSAAGDINGDGLTDVFYGVDRALWGGWYDTNCNPSLCGDGSGFHVQEETSPAPDLMTGVTDGFGAQSTWNYQSLAQLHRDDLPGDSYFGPYYYTSYPCNTSPKKSASASDYYCFASSMYVVSSYYTSNGIGGMREFTYQYQDAVYNGKGRGFQGFESIRVNDVAAGVETTTTFRQDFPYTGQVIESQTHVISSGVLIGDSFSDPIGSSLTSPAGSPTPTKPVCNVVKPDASAGTCPSSDTPGITYWVYPTQSVATKYDPNSGDQISQTVTTYSGAEPAYGHIDQVAATTTDQAGSYTTTKLTHYYDTAACQDAVGDSTVSTSVHYNNPLVTADYTSSHTEVYNVNGRCQVTDAWNDPVSIPTTVGGSVDPTQYTQYTRHTQTAYDETSDNAFGNPVSVTVGDGPAPQTAPFVADRSTLTTYTADGYFVASVTNPMGQVTRYPSYVLRTGEPNSVIAPDTVTTTYGYDSFGRKTSEQTGDMNPVTITYEAPSVYCSTYAYTVATQQVGATGKYACYDVLNRLARSYVDGFGGVPFVTTTDYDPAGRVADVTEPHLSNDTFALTIYTYDKANRISEKVDAKGVEADYVYEVNQNTLTTQITVKPPDGLPVPSTVSYEMHDSLGKLLSTTDAAGSVTGFEYDADGNPVVIQDAAGHQTLATYNKLDQKTQVVDPDQGTSNFNYDVLGELLNQTDANGKLLSFAYDNLGRMTSKIQPEGKSIWCYDGATWTAGTLPDPGSCGTVPAQGTYTGKPSAVSQYDGYHETYSYDSVDGHLISTDESINNSDYLTAMAYDSDGRLSKITYPGTVADAAPTVAIGPNQTVPPNTLVNLTGAGSGDTDSTGTSPFTVQWTQTSGPAVTITNPNSLNASFTTTATPGVSYGFSLLVSDGLQSATASVTITVPPLPGQPGNPTFTNGFTLSYDGTYTVSWTGVSVSGAPVDYRLEEATGTATAPGTFQEKPLGGLTATSYAENHSNNASYYYWYRVRAHDMSGFSAYSANSVIHVVVTPSPTPTLSPGGINVGTVNTPYTLSWTASSPKVTYYALQESKNDSTFSSPTTVYQGTARSWSTTKTVTTNEFYYRVKACNNDGSVTTCTAWSNISHWTINNPNGGGGGQLQAQPVGTTTTTSAPSPTTTTAPTPTTTTAPAPVNGAPTSGMSTGPTAMIASPKTDSDLALASPVHPRFAKPVYEAFADAHLMRASGTRPIIGLTVQYNYNANGYLQSLSDAANPGLIYYQANGMNARLQITDEAFGIINGNTAATSHRDYYPDSGYAENIQSGPGSATSGLQNLHYDWQALGNLADRHDLAKNISETFSYDALNRLTQADVTNGSTCTGPGCTVTYAYDALGNITCKSDVTGGTCSPGSTGYTYGVGAGPHAVTSTANGNSYGYDADGNMTNRNGTMVKWDSDNQPISIAQDANNSSAFNYAPDKHRYFQNAKVNGQTETTVYAGALEIVTDATGTHNRYNLSAYGKAVAVVDLESDTNGNPVINTQYLLTDHLGSVDEAVDTTGTLIAGTGWSFEAFGQRRDPASWQTPANSAQVTADRSTATSNGVTSGVTHRGFTGHEMLDNVNLIHMNGRVYDPVLGRFLSVDPVFQFPENTQSLNPYSYVLNNPLSATDPTGYKCVVDSHHSCGGGDPMTGSHIKGVHTGAKGDDLHTLTQQRLGRLLASVGIQLDSHTQVVGGTFENGATFRQGTTEPSEESKQPASGKTANPPVSDVSDKVDKNPWLGQYLHVSDDGTELTGDIPVAAGPGVSPGDLAKDEADIINAVNKTYSEKGKPDLTISIRFHAAGKNVPDANILHFDKCASWYCGYHTDTNGNRYYVDGGSNTPGNYVWLDNTSHMRDTTPGHELLHTFGLHHQNYGTESIMSYDSNRRMLYSDAERLLDAYKP